MSVMSLKGFSSGSCSLEILSSVLGSGCDPIALSYTFIYQ